MYLIRERLFRLGEDSDITDEQGRPVLHVDGKVAGREGADVRKRLFTPFGNRFTIDVPGPDDLEMEGDLFDHEFTIGRGDQTVATVSKRWFTVRDTYAVDVAPGQDDLLILASELALDLAEDPGAPVPLSPSVQPTTWGWSDGRARGRVLAVGRPEASTVLAGGMVARFRDDRRMTRK